MRRIHQDWSFRGPEVASSFRFPLLLLLALAIGIWTSPESWALTASPTSMTFQAVQGATNPLSQTVTVFKSTSRPSSWIATDNATWLTVSPGAGSIIGTAQVVLAVNIAGLAAGTYTATVTITVDKGGSSSVPVTLKVASATASPPPPPPTSSTQALLTWSAVIDSKLAGYKVYVGTRSGVYGTPVDVGNVTSYTVSNLLVGTTYYFVVTSYSSSGTESPYSNEVSKSVY